MEEEQKYQKKREENFKKFSSGQIEVFQEQ